jgi:hypothetical protein
MSGSSGELVSPSSMMTGTSMTVDVEEETEFDRLLVGVDSWEGGSWIHAGLSPLAVVQAISGLCGR